MGDCQTRLQVDDISVDEQGSHVADERVADLASMGGARRPPAQRRRVLISAFAVSPYRGSEPAAGWNIPLRLAAYHDVTVLCPAAIPHEPYREEISAYLAAHGPVAGLSFEYADLPDRAFRQIERSSDTPLGAMRYYAGYSAWQRAAYLRARQLHQDRPFALVHHLTLSGFREPGYLWRLGVPFVWGPLGGAANLPWPYMRIMGWQGRIHHCCRNVANLLQQRLGARSRRAGQAASMIWTTDEANLRMARECWNCRSVSVLPDSGACVSPLARVRDYDGKRPLRLVWSGQHIARKALPILLHALADIGPAISRQVVVLGDGPEAGAWKELARRLRVDAAIRWTGRIAHDQALAEVAEADVLVFTSLLEGSPHTVVEALSLGVPVICHDVCGMGAVVTGDCGIRIPPRGVDYSIRAFADAIRGLHRDPEQLRRLSAGAMRRAAELSWDAEAAQMADAYDQILGCRRGEERRHEA